MWRKAVRRRRGDHPAIGNVPVERTVMKIPPAFDGGDHAKRRPAGRAAAIVLGMLALLGPHVAWSQDQACAQRTQPSSQGVDFAAAAARQAPAVVGVSVIGQRDDWPTVDNNFVNQSFLGPESLNDSGLSLSYVVPTKFTGGQYVEAIAEVISGEGGGGEAPVLNNDAFVDSPALNLHVLWNTDIGRDWNMELGGSFLTGKHNDDNRQNVDLFGADLTLIHTDPSGRFNNQLVQAEAIYGNVDTGRSATQHSYGAYLLAQQQLNRDWYVGARLDWTKNALDERQEVWGVSPYVSWYWSEFLRFRMEYQHKGGDVKEEDTLYFQVVFIYGAHPPHPYWAMR